MRLSFRQTDRITNEGNNSVFTSRTGTTDQTRITTLERTCSGLAHQQRHRCSLTEWKLWLTTGLRTAGTRSVAPSAGQRSVATRPKTTRLICQNYHRATCMTRSVLHMLSWPKRGTFTSTAPYFLCS